MFTRDCCFVRACDNKARDLLMIDIILASYNGSRYIGQQIDSILAQTCSEWRLLIRDDGSSDDTVRICQDYAFRHPERIRLLTDSRGRLHVTGNFSELLSQSQGDYVMFCDQDDVWLPRKIEKTLAAMRDLETEHGASAPALAHTDSQIVDENLQWIAPSLMRYCHRKPNPTLNRLCMELPITGHTVMINRPLKELGGGIPEAFGSWDWWFPLVAVVFGHIRFVDEPLVLWRRHARTVTATRSHTLSSYLSRSLAQYHKTVFISCQQCEIFYERFGPRLSPKHQAFFASVSRIRRSNWAMRRFLIIRHRLFKTGFLKTLGVLIAV
jgi:glycosyltransferase involved in cell wall biosynthesis